jgi:hypothetical protein
MRCVLGHAGLVASLLLAANAWSQAIAIAEDGSIVEVPEAALATIGDASWAGWRGLQLPAPPRGESASVLALQDGQRLVGTFEPVGNELWWRSGSVGGVRVDLERVAWIGPPSISLEPVASRDQVRFMNGDRVEGFVRSIDAAHGVRVEESGSSDEARAVDHDLSRVVSVRLVPRPEPANGWRFWLRDGSVIDASVWSRDGERVHLRGCNLPSVAPMITLGWSDLVGIRRAPDSFIPLAALAWKASDVDDSPRLAPARVVIGNAACPLGIAPVDLHGPGQFEAGLEVSPARIDLSLDSPPGLAGKVACTVVLLDGDREISRVRVDSSLPTGRSTVVVTSGRLVVRIEGSDRGAFGGSVRLDRGTAIGAVRASPESSARSPSVPAPSSPSDATDPR